MGLFFAIYHKTIISQFFLNPLSQLMKNVLISFLLLIASAVHAQVTQRNILGNKYTLDALKQSLVAQNQFKPYPKTAAEWKAALPDSVIMRTIKTGEALLDYKFEPISATISMDFVRSGDRERHSKISFGKRNALIDLVLAERNGRGRKMGRLLVS